MKIWVELLNHTEADDWYPKTVSSVEQSRPPTAQGVRGAGVSGCNLLRLFCNKRTLLAKAYFHTSVLHREQTHASQDLNFAGGSSVRRSTAKMKLGSVRLGLFCSTAR